MNYTRLYADSDGETHFEDVEVEFAERKIWAGSPRLGLSTPQPTSDSVFLTSYEAFLADYHPTPRKRWFVVLSGLGEFGTSDGASRRFERGDVFLIDDMDSKGHTTQSFEPGTIMLVGLED